jgi:hypothetical protein
MQVSASVDPPRYSPVGTVSPRVAQGVYAMFSTTSAYSPQIVRIVTDKYATQSVYVLWGNYSRLMV